MKALRKNQIRCLQGCDECFTDGHIDLQLRRSIAKTRRSNDGGREGLSAKQEACEKSDEEKYRLFHVDES
jgi:hypothetical protein